MRFLFMFAVIVGYYIWSFRQPTSFMQELEFIEIRELAERLAPGSEIDITTIKEEQK